VELRDSELGQECGGGAAAVLEGEPEEEEGEKTRVRSD